MKLKIVSSGQTDVQIVDEDTGEKLENVAVLEIVYHGGNLGKARITLIDPHIDIDNVEADVETSEEYERRRSNSSDK